MPFIFPNKPIRIYDPSKIVNSLDHDWVVQEKWDGKRLMIECSADGVVTFWGRERQAWGKGWAWLSELPLEKPWFLDSEWLRDGRIFVWDYAIRGGQNETRRTYAERLSIVQAMLPTPVTQKSNTIASVGTLPAQDYEQILARKGEKHLEGIVWKQLSATNLWGGTSTSDVASCLKYRFF